MRIVLAAAGAGMLSAGTLGAVTPHAAEGNPATAPVAAAPAAAGAAGTAQAADGAERAAVLAAVDAFFDAMRERDADAWDELLVAAGNTWRWRREGAGGWTYRQSTNAASIDALRESESDWDERMYDPTILLRGPIAVVWTPYTFHLDGEFHHCGIDAFNLMKVEGRWRLADAMWTAEVEDCAELVPPAALESR